jgi:mono/diheme cytochrome c family protein
MKALLRKKYFWVTTALAAGILIYSFTFKSGRVDYNTQVKPIFNKKCIACHGGVKKKANFSLLFRSEALDTTESGKPAIIPGNPDRSELIKRITSADPEERMPYKEHALSEEEISILRQWIKDGAKWGDHWAYVAVKPVEVPKPKGKLWGLISPGKIDGVKNDIDYFIYDKLKQEELTASAEADKSTLLRRVSLDLIGLPAPKKIAEQYLHDTSGKAYENLVDSLLSLPQYGERWTAMWLDLARYADTKGYERDDNRSVWRYRDWLIDAFNNDKPYDSFLTEQIAGDLLPDPTDAQYIATAFHRNTMTNDEGGTENEEFRTAAVIDRVNTTWEAIMGTTFACVQCHSHPYDPFRHDEYYKFLAFYNNTRDEDAYAEYPLFHEYKKEDSAKFEKLKDWLKSNIPKERNNEIITFLKTWQPAVNSLVADSFVNAELADTKWLVMRKNSAARLPQIDLNNKNLLLFRYTAGPKDGKLIIRLDSAKGPVLTAINIISTKLKLKPEWQWKLMEAEFPAAKGLHTLHLEYSSKELKKPENDGVFFDWFYFAQTFPGKGIKGYDSAFKYYHDLLNSPNVDVTSVMMENPEWLQRATHVFERGNWLVKGKQVYPDVPHSLNPLPQNAPRNRLGLAKWLTSKENPLTARTMVNRLWEQLFGTGLAETLEDMGTQGIPPTHPELLDHLSWKFMNDYKWSLKKLLKEIVMSATYRQDSKVTPEHLQKDANNRFYARMPRVRLSAEQLRDQALVVSGAINYKMYGASVMPYQPQGIWVSPYSNRKWEISTGGDQYRRAIYTFWKRTSPYPSMITFDGVAREVCTARRIRTNTPLQALVTLNDSAYLNASRYFAYRLKKEAGSDVKKQISKGYELAVGKSIDAEKYSILEKLYREALEKFRKDKDKTCEMIGIQNEHNNPETAALVVVTSAIFNLDEFITKN